MDETVGQSGEDNEHVSDEGHGPEVEGVSPSDSWLPDAEGMRVLNFAAHIADHLGMPKYRWMLGDEPSDEDCHAAIKVSSKRYVAVISVNAKWVDYTDHVKAETISHEVLHAFLSRLDEIWDQSAFNEHTPTAHSLVLQRVWTREMELVVDLLTMYVDRKEDLVAIWKEAEPTPGQEMRKS
jgi:hypothetical protein